MATEQAIERVFREEGGAVIATLIRILGDFDAAEDALHEALTSALERWPDDGVPESPGAWIMTTARRKAIDRLRRGSTVQKTQGALTALSVLEQEEEDERAESEESMDSSVPDDRLRLIFTCCHPSLSREAQVALTLRTLCGLTTTQIARAFLSPDETLAQRLVRAKRKIKDARIPYRVPPPEALAVRLESVLAVVYLVFNEGYAASEGDALVRVDLCAEAMRLGRLLVTLIPDEPEIAGLLSLMLLHDARRDTRIDEDGDLVLLEDQDRSRWNRPQIDEGRAILQAALRQRRPGPYQLQAAVAAVHAEAPRSSDTDWAQIAELYRELHRMHPTAVIALNGAVAVAMATTPARGLALIDPLRDELDEYCPFHAARADLLRRMGKHQPAAEAYRRAIELAENQTMRRYLSRRLREVSS